jgi:hypothetical protein
MDRELIAIELAKTVRECRAKVEAKVKAMQRGECFDAAEGCEGTGRRNYEAPQGQLGALG